MTKFIIIALYYEGIKQKGQTSICFARDLENAKNLMQMEKLGAVDREDCDLEYYL